jgi:hypothetical protein
LISALYRVQPTPIIPINPTFPVRQIFEKIYNHCGYGG